ncbi:MAG: hypothetical protein AB7W59_11800, partial [Acidimicrobiia bacterium]
MSTCTLSPASAAYLAAVEAELDDLPFDVRAELLDDLADHLAALAETDDLETGDLEELHRRLGRPAPYAAELRASAGLPQRPPGGATPTPPRPPLGDRIVATGAYRFVDGYRAELRVTWWAARAVLATLLVAAVTGDASLPLPAVLGSRLVGLVTVGLMLWGSFELGRRQLDGRTNRYGRSIAVGGAAVAGLGVLALGADGFDGQAIVYDEPVGAVPYGMWNTDGEPITNLFVY